MKGVVPKGALGLPYTDVGGAIQELCSVLEDRGHSRERIIHQLHDGTEHGWFREYDFWEQVLGPVVDTLAEWLDLPAFPEEDK